MIYIRIFHFFLGYCSYICHNYVNQGFPTCGPRAKSGPQGLKSDPRPLEEWKEKYIGKIAKIGSFTGYIGLLK